MDAISPDTGSTNVVVEYMSTESPTVTHLRGSVLVATLQTLRIAGYFERYCAALAPESHDDVLNALAVSWVPTKHVLAHCRAGDALELSDRALHELGRTAAEQMGESTLNTVWRGAQAMRVGSGWWVTKQADRMWARLYRGGGCTVMQTGPKDSIFEAHGVPMLESRFYRALHHGFMLGLGKLLGATCYVKPVSPRIAHPYRVAIAFSWV